MSDIEMVDIPKIETHIKKKSEIGKDAHKLRRNIESKNIKTDEAELAKDLAEMNELNKHKI